MVKRKSIMHFNIKWKTTEAKKLLKWWGYDFHTFFSLFNGTASFWHSHRHCIPTLRRKNPAVVEELSHTWYVSTKTHVLVKQVSYDPKTQANQSLKLDFHAGFSCQVSFFYPKDCVSVYRIALQTTWWAEFHSQLPMLCSNCLRKAYI